MYSSQLEKSADYWDVDYFRKCKEGIWLPNEERPEGFAQIDSWQDRNIAGSYAHDHAKILADVYHASALGSTLGRVGIRAYVGGSGYRDIESSQVYFPTVATLNERVQQLNQTLPDEHRLPEFVAHEGGSYKARDFLKSLAEGKILAATSSGASRAPGNRLAVSTVHDMVFHTPYWLALPPSAMQTLQTRATEALLATPEDAVETDSTFPKLKTGQLMGALDRGISAYAMKNLLLDGYSRATQNFTEAFGANSYAIDPVAQDVREHVAFLGEHVSALDIAA